MKGFDLNHDNFLKADGRVFGIGVSVMVGISRFYVNNTFSGRRLNNQYLHFEFVYLKFVPL